MVLEIADMQIKPGLEHEFEQKVASSLPIFQNEDGGHPLRLVALTRPRPPRAAA